MWAERRAITEGLCQKWPPRKLWPQREIERARNTVKMEFQWVSDRLRACNLVKINKSFFVVVFFFRFFFRFISIYFTNPIPLHIFSLFQCLASLQSLPQLWCVWVCAASICEMCVCIMVADGLRSFRIDNIYRLKWESSIFTRLLSEAGPNFIIPNY